MENNSYKCYPTYKLEKTTPITNITGYVDTKLSNKPGGSLKPPHLHPLHHPFPHLLYHPQLGRDDHVVSRTSLIHQEHVEHLVDLQNYIHPRKQHSDL